MLFLEVPAVTRVAKTSENSEVWIILLLPKRRECGKIRIEAFYLSPSFVGCPYMPVTMTEVAKKVGVSVAVVSRLLRGDPTLRISDKRRQQILLTKDELGGVYVNRNRDPRTHTILAAVNRMFTLDWISANQDCLFTAVEENLQKKKFHLNFGFFDPKKKNYFFQSLFHSHKRCDGVVLLSQITDEKICELVRQFSFPHVAIGSEAERYRVNTVRPDAAEGIRKGLEHLRELGHRHIGYLGSRESRCYQEFVAIMMSMGLPVEPKFSCVFDSIDIAASDADHKAVTRKFFTQWFDSRPLTTAIFCERDVLALDVIDIMRARGMKPGRELSIIGNDNIEERGQTPTEKPVLTTIDTPWELIGQRAAEVLLNQILHKQLQIIHERLPVELILRESTGPCPQE